MKILFLTQIVPYPLDAGPKIKTWNVLRYLSERGHDVTLLTFMRPEEEQYIERIRRLCSQVWTVPIRRSRWKDAFFYARGIFTGRPFIIERDDLAGMRKLMAQLLATSAYDVIHADQLTMAQFVMTPRGTVLPAISEAGAQKPILVFDAHNAVWTIIDRMKSNAAWFLKPILALELARVKRTERLYVRRFDHTLSVTKIDKQALIQTVMDEAVDARDEFASKIHVIPIAVDTDELQRVARTTNSNQIVTVGTLHYPPNADGIRWFVREVFPLVLEKAPSTKLVIIGKNPPSDLIQNARENPQTIEVTGYVPELTPYVAESALMVIPVRAGGGMRVRILEAFSMGIPVVTTTVGLEGIDAAHGEDVLVADTPESFANQVVGLLKNQELQQRLGVNSRQLAVTRYDWKSVLREMDVIYGVARKDGVAIIDG